MTERRLVARIEIYEDEYGWGIASTLGYNTPLTDRDRVHTILSEFLTIIRWIGGTPRGMPSHCGKLEL